jgi:hypothetical protein
MTANWMWHGKARLGKVRLGKLDVVWLGVAELDGAWYGRLDAAGRG